MATVTHTHTLTPDEGQLLAEMALTKGLSAAEEMATSNAEDFIRSYDDLGARVELIRDLLSGRVSDVAVVRELALEAKHDGAVGVVNERRSYERLKGGNMDYCHIGYTPSESEAVHVSAIASSEREANLAQDVLERLAGT